MKMTFRLSSGLGLAYQTRGAGPVIILLHPVGLHGDFWASVIEHLSDAFRLIAIDLRGHGGSDVSSRPFSLDDMAGDVVELVRAIGQAPCAIAGCSLGGMVAMGAALQAPKLFNHVVFSNTSHTRTEHARKALDSRVQAALAGMGKMRGATLERWFTPEFRAQQPHVISAIDSWLMSADPVVHSQSWAAIRDLAYGKKLSALSMPVLITTGDKDQSVSAEDLKALAGDVPKSETHVFADAGHLTPLEQPQAYAAELRQFINSK